MTSSTLATAMGLMLVACALGTTLAVVRARRSQRSVLIDGLTGLMNRSALTAELMEWSVDRDAALLLIDIDHFSELNEAFGQPVGDQVLIALADRVRALADADGLIARWGSDEFALVVPDVSGRAALGELAEAVSRAMQEPVTVGAVEITLTTHVAAGSWPVQASDWPELLGKVDLALHRAKSSWKSTVIYDPKPDSASAQQLALAGELRRAIDGDQLRLRYQPRIRLADGAVVGAEALVRWQHPKRGLLGPGAFIPLAEAAGLVGALTRRVLAIAVADAGKWQADGWELSVSVNLSPQDLGDVGLATYVEDLLDTHGLSPELLTLEVTESAFMADASFGAELLDGLTRRGITVAIDDFGTGYSSLARVATMPARELKIDQGFVADISSAGSNAVIRASIDLAHNLDMIVVAEGVETSEQYTQLLELGCDDAQGFWLGKPMALKQLLSEAERWDNDKRSVKMGGEDEETPAPAQWELLAEPASAAAEPEAPATWAGRAFAAGRRLLDGIGVLPVVALAGYLLAAAAWILVGGERTLSSAPLAAFAAGASGWAASRRPGRGAPGWTLVALAAAVLTVGAVFPAVTVVAAVLAIAGLLSFPGEHHRSRRQHLLLLLDTGTVAVAAAAAAWVAVIGPELHNGGRVAHELAAIVPPLVDAALFVVVAFTLLRGVAPTYSAAVRWVGAGFAAIAIADAVGGRAGGAALVGLAAVGLGALSSTRDPSAETGREPIASRVAWLPHAGVLALTLLLVVGAATSDVRFYPLGGLLIAAVLLMTLATTRQLLGLDEGRKLVGRFTALARTDPLTGLANRRQLIEEGERVFERSRRDGSSMAALMVDVDHFKLANEQHGHAVGDAILEQVAKLCVANVLGRDLVGRYGGDEIVVLLTGADAAAAETLARRLNDQASQFTPAGLDYTMTVSVGVAASSSASSLGGLIRNAERGLAEAKKAGRNETALFHPPLFAAS